MENGHTSISKKIRIKRSGPKTGGRGNGYLEMVMVKEFLDMKKDFALESTDEASHMEWGGQLYEVYYTVNKQVGLDEFENLRV